MRLVITCATLLALHVPSAAARGQEAWQPPRTLAGASVALGVYGGESDNSELLDIAPVFGLTASHRLGGAANLGVRVDATLSPLNDASADDVHDARTHVVVLTAGPTVELDVHRSTFYLTVVAGAAATVSRGTTIRATGAPGPRRVDETTVSPAWGLAAGLRLVTDTGAFPWAMEIGARVIDMSTLTFVRPRTDTFERDPDLFELRVGLLLGL